MPKRYGKCTNFGGCPIADSHKVIEVNEGDDFSCPAPPEGCGLPLYATDAPLGGDNVKKGPRNLIVIIIAGVIVLAAGGYFGWGAYHSAQLKKQRAKFTADSLKADSIAKANAIKKLPFQPNTGSAKADSLRQDSLKKIAEVQKKQHKLDSLYKLDSARRLKPVAVPVITAGNMEKAFNKMGDANTPDATKQSLKRGILALFSSSQAEVIPVNSSYSTPTGMTIGKYLDAISITQRIITIDRFDKAANGKISAVYITEK